MRKFRAARPSTFSFSADILYAQKLIDARLADPNSLVIYARAAKSFSGRPADAHLNLSRDGFAALRDPRVQKIAIANPDHAPYGRAAVAALQHAGIYDRLKSKLVYGENISQAAQFAQSGSAQVGILALSLALSPNMKSGDRWLIPPSSIHRSTRPPFCSNSSANKPSLVRSSNSSTATRAAKSYRSTDSRLPKSTFAPTRENKSHEHRLASSSLCALRPPLRYFFLSLRCRWLTGWRSLVGAENSFSNRLSLCLWFFRRRCSASMR